MNQIVVYYSNKGSNKFLAEKIARRLSCDIEAIRPRIDSFGLFLTTFNPGIRPLKHDPGDYERVIMVGPVWMGRFIPPLRSFVNRYRKRIRQLVFVTCCGSPYSRKDEKFGHGLVFKEVKSILDDRLVLTQAFPVGLVLPEDRREDPEAFMNTHLNDGNFNGEIRVRFEDFMNQLSKG